MLCLVVGGLSVQLRFALFSFLLYELSYKTNELAGTRLTLSARQRDHDDIMNLIQIPDPYLSASALCRRALRPGAQGAGALPVCVRVCVRPDGNVGVVQGR
jgi:hypothetical protein